MSAGDNSEILRADWSDVLDFDSIDLCGLGCFLFDSSHKIDDGPGFALDMNEHALGVIQDGAL